MKKQNKYAAQLSEKITLADLVAERQQWYELQKYLREKINLLKDLLMQSRIYVKINTEDYEDRTVSKAEKAEAKKLLTKIDEVTNEN